jgi:hypothetical protein
MGLLTPKGKKDDKKKNNLAKNTTQSKFIANKNPKGAAKKPLTGGSQRGS